MVFRKKVQENSQNIKYVDLNDEIELLETISFVPGPQHYIALKDGGCMEMLEVWGKDLDFLGDEETSRTLNSFLNWLTEKVSEGTFYTTTLPTNVDSQLINLRKKLGEVRRDLRMQLSERQISQLRDRESILLEKIDTQERIRQEMYNTEFILFLFEEDARTLDGTVAKAKSGELSLQSISKEKKIQILKQYNNMNEKV